MAVAGPADPPTSVEQTEATLLSSLKRIAAVHAALGLALDHGDDLGAERANEVLRRAQRDAGAVGRTLDGLVRGLPPDVLALLGDDRRR